MGFREKRRLARANARWPGKLITADNRVFRIKMKNISANGAQLSAPVALTAGDEVTIEINMLFNDIKRNIRARCVVNYGLVSNDDMHQIGVVFTEVSEADFETIVLYCKVQRDAFMG